MDIKRTHNIWKLDESGLGFYCVNTFQCSWRNPNIKALLRYKILKEEQFGHPDYEEYCSKNLDNIYGPILLNEILPSDFLALSFDELKSEIEDFWNDEDWGEDLPIFKKNFNQVISDLENENLSERKFYYVNMDRLPQAKLIAPHFFDYLVCIIATKKNSYEVITMTFGLD